MFTLVSRLSLALPVHLPRILSWHRLCTAQLHTAKQQTTPSSAGMLRLPSPDGGLSHRETEKFSTGSYCHHVNLAPTLISPACCITIIIIIIIIIIIFYLGTAKPR